MELSKKIASIVLCLIMIFGIVAVGGEGLADLMDALFIKASAAYSVGDTIYYGAYPQSDVTSSLGSVLNSQNGTWQSYNYYSGSGSQADGQMTASNYMRYKDVTYNGNKYRGVIFDSYRPYCTGYTSIKSNTYQYDNGYTTGNVYWFKYEPLKWRVLNPSTGLVMCETIIDSQPYNNYCIQNGKDGNGFIAYWGDSAQIHYANDWDNSSLRAWLNNDFYKTAFSSSEKSNILTTTNSNKCYYTLTGNSGFEEYDSDDTQDKVFLLSYDEATNSAYGFDSTSSNDETPSRFQGSDYAKCQGLYVIRNSGSEYDGNSWWWLRTAYNNLDNNFAFACNAFHIGYAYSNRGVGYTGDGVVPVLKLLKLESHIDELIYSTGDIIYYGTYPQSDVSSSLGPVLNSQSGTWQSYNYYSGSGPSAAGRMTSSNYMRYKDVTYNSNKYRGVTFDRYRGYTSESNGQHSNGYETNTIYWFKYEPLKWRVLNPSTGLIMCETIIDSQPYNNFIIENGKDGNGYTAYWGDSAQTHYANDWANSSLRAWLNEDFYNTAFSYSEKENILITTNSNKCWYTLNGNIGYEEYDGADTQDKVFLLSWDEVTNSAYGFDSTASNYDTARRLQNSDYAKCQGLSVSRNQGSEYDGYSGWWLRSPHSYSRFACGVSGGRARDTLYVSDACYGVVPALKLLNLSSLTADTEYTVKFISDGKTLSEEKLKEGDAITKPADPEKEGYTFKGWDVEVPAKMPANDLIFTAVFEKNPDKPDTPDNPAPTVPNIKIKGYTKELKADYKSKLTFNVENVPTGYEAVWNVNGKDYKGSSYTINQATEKEYKITVSLVKDGKIVKTSDEEVIKVDTGFFAKIIAFFRSLFKALPEYVDNKKTK